MSMATSSPLRRAARTKRSKSSNVPRSGWMESCPPSGEPMAYGLPGSLGLGVEGVVRPLRAVVPDRVDRGEVDDVEAHRGDRAEPLGRGAQGAATASCPSPRRGRRPRTAGRSRTRRRRARARARRAAGMRGWGSPSRGTGAGRTRRASGRTWPRRSRSTAGRPVSRSAATASSSRAALEVGRWLVEAALEHPGALLEHQLGVDVGLDLDRRVVHPRAPGVGPALDAVGPPARPVGGDGRAPPAEAGVVDVHGEVVVDAVGVGEHGRSR